MGPPLGQVDCETVKKWILKNSAESENLNWILANTKPCPKCKRPIEKNQVGDHASVEVSMFFSVHPCCRPIAAVAVAPCRARGTL